MPFTEDLKLRVKRQAAFRCCRCGMIGVEVHHILPQGQGGPDTDDNAAPLCPNCHSYFGANPDKRKEIRQMRDWWYEVCKPKYAGQPDETDETEKKLDELIAELRKREVREQERQAVVDEINRILQRLTEQLKVNISDEADEVVEKVDKVVTAVQLGEGVYSNVHCRRCNSYVGLLIGSASCPNCGAPFEDR